MEAKKYVIRPSLKQQFLLLWPMLLRYVFLIAVYVHYMNWNFNAIVFWIPFSILFVMDIGPALALNIEYSIKTSRLIIEIDEELKTISYTWHNTKRVFSFDDISALEYYTSFGRGTGVYSFENYRYYKITFKDQTQIPITSLMMNKIQKRVEPLLGMKAEKNPTFLPFV
ncbi:MAG: hypothetical protein J0H74_36860 [Chitinophagaceae bacterium]|nr:hypothetical protein [Chitinophagaceae bacterium]